MQDITQALHWRYATKTFDSTKNVSDADLHTILESGRLAPSAYGLEPWHFFVIKQPELQAKLRAASYNQAKVTEAPYLVVIARRTDARAALVPELLERTAATTHTDIASLDGLKNMVEGAMGYLSDAELDAWIRAQTYIALGTMTETAALLGIDSCPMEGFVASEVDAILGLSEKHLTATTMLALGYRGSDETAQRPKVRRAFEDVVTFLR